MVCTSRPINLIRCLSSCLFPMTLAICGQFAIAFLSSFELCLLSILIIRLAATLGSKSSLKRLQKRDILSVDVPEACTFLSNPPDEPLALRLSSNLMYGVTRVFSQQYTFFYSIDPSPSLFPIRFSFGFESRVSTFFNSCTRFLARGVV